MSICLSSQNKIEASDFKNSSYDFSVESILGTRNSAEHLTISASTGYLLSTSPTGQPRREQTFEYIQQADNSWIASGIVTVLLNGEVVVDGTIVIQNSLAESVVLTIVSNSVAIKKPQKTALAINSPTLTFAPTVPGRPSFLVLTINQQQDDLPVTLTTDATDVFQLATDSSPRFGPTVTFTPSPMGSYVHVRYMADQRGLHTAQLLLTSAYENTAITLTGRSKGLLPAMTGSQNHPPVSRIHSSLLTLLVLGGIAFVIFSNIYQLLPALTKGGGTYEVETHLNTTRSNLSKSDANIKRNDTEKPENTSKSTSFHLSKPTEQIVSDSNLIPVMKKKPVNTLRNDLKNANEHKPLAGHNSINSRIHRQSGRDKIKDQQTQESDLERELNQTVPR